MEEIKKVLSYMNTTNGRKRVWVNQDCLYTDFSAIKGGENTQSSDSESNALLGANGDVLVFQSQTISIGNNKIFELREYGERGEILNSEKVPVSELFPNKDVIILTNGDNVNGIVPIFGDKFELAKYLELVKEYIATLPEEDRCYWSQEFSNIVRMGKFFYQNNPDKVESILDLI